MTRKTKKSPKTSPKTKALFGGGLILVFLFAFGQGLLENYFFYPAAPTPDYPEPQNETEARIQDLDYLELYVRGYDRSFSFRARGQALEMIQAAKEKAGEYSFAEFELVVSKIVAMAENSHSNVWSGSRSRRHSALPFHGYWFDDGFYIVSIKPEYSDLLGAKITHLGSTPIAEVYALLRPYFGGQDTGFKAYSLPFLLENTAFLETLGIINDASNPVISVIKPDGEIETLTLKALPADPERTTLRAWQWLKPTEVDGENRQWKRIFENETGQPFYNQNTDVDFQLKPLPEIDGLYVQYRRNNDGENYTIGAFNDDIRTAIREISPTVLVIDVRFNGGGDGTKTAGLMFDMPSLLPEGARIYAISGHETFSAGINTLGFLKEAAGDQMTIVGRRIGDSPLSWGETNDFVLPNSGIGITATRGLHDQINGCYDPIQCHWSSFDYPAAVGSLYPDVPVVFTFADYFAKRDAALEIIFELEGLK